MSRMMPALLGALLLGALGYAAGSGWIRIEDPRARSRPREAVAEDAPLDAEITRAQFIPPAALAPAVVGQTAAPLPNTLAIAGLTDPAAPTRLILTTPASSINPSAARIYFRGARLQGTLKFDPAFAAIDPKDVDFTFNITRDGINLDPTGRFSPLPKATQGNFTAFAFTLDAPGAYVFTVTAKRGLGTPVTVAASLDWNGNLPFPETLSVQRASGTVAAGDTLNQFSEAGPTALPLSWSFAPTALGDASATPPIAGTTFNLDYASGFTAVASLRKIGPSLPTRTNFTPSTSASFSAPEAGVYELTVRVARRDQPTQALSLTNSFTVVPANGTPVLQVLEMGGFSINGAQVAVGKLDGTSQPSANFAVKAKSDRAANLVVINAATREILGGPVASAANTPVTITADLSRQAITADQLDLQVIDTWTVAESQTVSAVFAARPTVASDTPAMPDFPEYTRPRKYPNGFNESDKVTTRVARLYYQHDARRVAQIINQAIQPFNKASVDTRNLQAITARKDADNATDARRRQEALAVRAASEARAAEGEQKRAQAEFDRTQNEHRSNQTSITAIQNQVAANTDRIAATDARINSLSAAIASAPAGDPTVADKKTQLAELQTEKAALASDNAELQKQLSVATATRAGFDAAVSQASTKLDTANQRVQSLRVIENRESDGLLKDDQIEERARADQFRKEVAAAEEDPNYYVAGVPTSDDPVKQVSITVIGEGLIQLRGPLKGINVIRMMIDQIDAPTGQVRVNIHTVQINGEKGNRMETVATKIQDQIDHSRFLTLQSAQMLRKAVNRVASRRAVEATPGATEAETMRLKYMDGFFGGDFIRELTSIDSEFLRGGNKLLGLNSMDTTSLASSLFLLGLADNDARAEILEEFRGMLASDLVQAEQEFYAEGGPRGKTGPLAHLHKEKFQLMAMNARFTALQGYFNGSEMDGRETLSPMQREFLKLAQILKSRLVTEKQYYQRVKERALLEQRFVGSYEEEIRRQDERERKARAQFEAAQQARSEARIQLGAQFQSVGAIIANQQNRLAAAGSSLDQFTRLAGEVRLVDLHIYEEVIKVLHGTRKLDNVDISRLNKRDFVDAEKAREMAPYKFNSYVVMLRNNSDFDRLWVALQNLELGPDAKYRARPFAEYRADAGGRPEFIGTFALRPRVGATSPILELQAQAPSTDADTIKLLEKIRRAVYDARKVKDTLDNYVFYDADAVAVLAGIEKPLADLEAMRVGDAKTQRDLLMLSSLRKLMVTIDQLATLVQFVKLFVAKADQGIEETRRLLTRDEIPVADARRAWSGVDSAVRDSFKDLSTGDGLKAMEVASAVSRAFSTLETAEVAYVTARDLARRSRLQLDQKKMLDALIDDVEDKLIELLEGTRAHTSNIDSYIRAISTALEDDFNTQFYFPAFREIRKASRFWDVSFADIETTSILTNNRGFGKVDPQATMEFDLPKRDILIAEAMKGAKAMMEEYGALLEDPSFLALAKLNSGSPTSMALTGFGDLQSSVRNVLPGLPSTTDQQLFRQSAPGNRTLGSPLESLIPDPAVYKFETGTGYEIRPVFQPDGQSVTFDFDYMYTTNVREPVRADEKHLGRIKRQFVHTPVQLLNYEMKEVSRYKVALKASRTSRGVPLFEDIPGVGILFRPLPSAESSLQENIILAQSTIFPTMFDLMGLRWAPVVADLDPLRLTNADFIVNARKMFVEHFVYDRASSFVDDTMGVPPADRRPDLYRDQTSEPVDHPNGYRGPGLGRYSTEMEIERPRTERRLDGLFAPDGTDESRLNGREHLMPRPPLTPPNGEPIEGKPIESSGNFRRGSTPSTSTLPLSTGSRFGSAGTPPSRTTPSSEFRRSGVSTSSVPSAPRAGTRVDPEVRKATGSAAAAKPADQDTRDRGLFRRFRRP